MLNIVFGTSGLSKNAIRDVRLRFKKDFIPEWFVHPFVQEFLKDIKGIRVLKDDTLRDEYGNVVPYEKLSIGCKALCVILFEGDKRYVYGSVMGGKCIPYLLRIATEFHDVNLYLEGMLTIPDEYFEKGLIFVNGEKATCEEYRDAFRRYIEGLSYEV